MDQFDTAGLQRWISKQAEKASDTPELHEPHVHSVSTVLWLFVFFANYVASVHDLHPWQKSLRGMCKTWAYKTKISLLEVGR